MRRALKIAGPVAVVLVAATLVLAGQGNREIYDGSRKTAPAWARPCFERAPRTERTLLHRCARVRGRVLYVQRRSGNEVHLATIAHWHLLIVKLDQGADPPSVGSTATFVGPLLRTHYRFVPLEEVEAFRIG